MGSNAEYNQKQHLAAKERALRAIRLRAAGETWETIGKLLGVSKQRAQALAARHAKGT
jgi:ParB-like chromosome segregation protein Spo0J